MTARRFNGLRVLVVEDDPSALAYTIAVLRSLGVRDIAEAQNGAAAVVKVTDEKALVDLVICDWNMPVVSGLDVTRELRRDRPDLPIVMATARTDSDSAVLASRGGVDGYLVKPFSSSQLADVLQRALTSRKAA